MENKLIQTSGSVGFKNYDNQGEIGIWQREKCGIDSVPKILSKNFYFSLSLIPNSSTNVYNVLSCNLVTTNIIYSQPTGQSQYDAFYNKDMFQSMIFFGSF